jgi:hypothetical protein
MAASTDLWGEIEATQIRTPLVILREQAALLGTKTKNLVEASVKTHANGDAFAHNFNLVVPALDNYTYNLFTITHGPSIYPISVLYKSTQFETEQEFIEWLGAKLSSPDTKRIVANLLAQVAA